MHTLRILLSTAVILSATSELSGALAFSTLNFPEAKYTSLEGIDGDRIVGYYTDDQLQTHGFFRDGSTWVELGVPFPDAHSTRALGVSGDRIVGEYFPGPRAFLFQGGLGGGAYTKLDFPGSSTGEAHAVDGNQIVGRHEFGAFLYDGTTWTNLAYPGSIFTVPLGIDNGKIVGFYQEGDFTSPRKGFLFDGITWQPLNYPGSQQTEIHAIDGDRLVGTWWDENQSHGFLYAGGSWLSFDHPESVGTVANDISGNRIVGSYADLTGNSRPFLATILDVQVSIENNRDGTVTLSFPTATGQSYTINHDSAVGGTFANVLTHVTGTGLVTNIVQSASESARYYRLQMSLPE